MTMNNDIVKELLCEAKFEKDLLPGERFLNDDEIAAQYADFKCTHIVVEPSEVHDNWFNFTLELEFPNADNEDFSDYVIENGYYNREDDRWGFYNWYPENTSEQIKKIVLDEIEKLSPVEKPSYEPLQLVFDGIAKAKTEDGKYVLLDLSDNSVAYRRYFDTEKELDDFIAIIPKGEFNDIVESLLKDSAEEINETSDELVNKVHAKRQANFDDAEKKIENKKVIDYAMDNGVSPDELTGNEKKYGQAKLKLDNNNDLMKRRAARKENDDLAEGLLNEISDEVVNRTTGRRASDYVWAKINNNDEETVENFRNKLNKNLDLVYKRAERKGLENPKKLQKDVQESVITEEDMNDLLSMNGERYTDIADLDMPEPLKGGIPTTEDGNPITLESLYTAISELTTVMADLVSAVKQPKVELAPLENPMGAKKAEEEVIEEEPIAEEPVEKTDEKEETDEKKSTETEKGNDKDGEKKEDLAELEKEIESELVDDDKKEKNETLEDAKKEIDKAIDDKKSPAEIDATIDYVTDNDADEKAANEYKVQKMKESFRKTVNDSLLSRMRWGK